MNSTLTNNKLTGERCILDGREAVTSTGPGDDMLLIPRPALRSPAVAPEPRAMSVVDERNLFRGWDGVTC